MGLAMTYGIVKNHQGYIGVSSEAGEGTTMNVYLPVAVESTENKSSDVDGISFPWTWPYLSGGRR